MIGNELPASGHKNPEWWTQKNSVNAKAWQSIGWSIKEVNPKEKTVILTRPELLIPEEEGKRQKTCPLVSLPEYKPRKKKSPSLTRIAIAQARLENIYPKKFSMKKYRGKFRPRSA